MSVSQGLSPSSSVSQPTVSVPAKREGRTLILYGLSLLAALSFAITAYLALVFAGTDLDQGNVQRIFYFHVAAFSGGSVAFFASVVGGLMYLKTRNPKWDTLALAGVEVGFMLSLITLITGMVWARPIWNTWWTWDPRLTSAAIMVLTYAAYLMLRGALENPDKRRLFASVYGILAFGTVIFTFIIIRIRPDTIHPVVVGSGSATAQGGFDMAHSMAIVLGFASVAFCCLITPALMWWRIRLENHNNRAEALRQQLKG